MHVIDHPGEVLRETTGAPTPLELLVDRWRSGDPAAFREVVGRFQGPLLSYVLSVLGHLQDAEDVVQETLMSAHASVHRLREPASLWGWLKRIAHNAAVDAARKSGRHGTPTDPSLLGEIGEEAGAGENDEPPGGPSLEAIVREIERLPETYRQAAVYHFLQEWPCAKIAAALGIDAANARQRISRAGRMIRTALSTHGNSAP